MLFDDCLIHGDPSEVAAFLGVSLRTLRRYQKHPDQMPEACKKLLRLRMEGNLRAIGGNDWDGFYLQAGELFLPLWERGFRPEHIKAMFFEVQELAWHRSEAKRLQNELEAVKAELVRERYRAEEYRGLAAKLPRPAWMQG